MDAQPVLQYDVAYPERLSRLLIFVKWLLIIPHMLVIAVLFFALLITSIVAWFAILITGNYPRGLFDFAVMTLRWGARMNAYVLLQRDEYPPFSGDADYPVLYELDYPSHLSRWKIFVKLILLIPHFIILYLLNIVMQLVTIIAWFAILFTGNYPRGLFDFFTGGTRWVQRVTVYAFLLTDAYPPFSMEPVASPTAPAAPAPSF